MVNKNSAVRAKKASQIKKIYELLGQYTQIVLVSLENVSSLQSQQIRKVIYANKGELVIGKNTIILKAIDLRINGFNEQDPDYAFLKDIKNKNKIPNLASIIPLIKDKVGFIFSEQPVFELKPLVEANKVSAPAKVGTISTIDVIIPPGPTGMDPSQIGFFHALSISTKIQKGQIEITKDYQVCAVGKKIGNSEVALLEKMNLRPMSYQMRALSCYDNGDILGQEVISMSPSTIINAFQAGVKNLAAISLETGYQTAASVPYSIVNAFKNLAAIGLEVNYKFEQLTNLGSGAPAPAAAGGAPAAKAAAPVKEEAPKEEEEDVDMGGLFD